MKNIQITTILAAISLLSALPQEAEAQGFFSGRTLQTSQADSNEATGFFSGRILQTSQADTALFTDPKLEVSPFKKILAAKLKSQSFTTDKSLTAKLKSESQDFTTQTPGTFKINEIVVNADHASISFESSKHCAPVIDGLDYHFVSSKGEKSHYVLIGNLKPGTEYWGAIINSASDL
ncbi:MAG: hypothetical protein AAF591_22915, partial [Verrucomicrobiota bacterium]